MLGSSRCSSCRRTSPCCVVRVMSSPRFLQRKELPLHHFPRRRQGARSRARGAGQKASRGLRARPAQDQVNRVGGSVLIQIPLRRLPRSRCAPEAQGLPAGLRGAGPARDPQGPSVPRATGLVSCRSATLPGPPLPEEEGNRQRGCANHRH